MKNLKSLITNELNLLKKFGFEVKTMNSLKAMPIGMKGFPDHVIIGKKYIVFVEVKIGADKMSSEQIKFNQTLWDVSEHNKYMRVKEIKTLEEARILCNALIMESL